METRLKRKQKVGRTAFERGLKAEKILGVSNNPEMQFLIKFQNCDVPEVVRAKIANEKCPQLVIAYYEERLHYET